jgi:hypothetical protein
MPRKADAVLGVLDAVLSLGSKYEVGRTFPDSRAARRWLSSITTALGYDHGWHGNGQVP